MGPSGFFSLAGPLAAWVLNTSTAFIGVGGVPIPGTGQFYVGLSVRNPVAGAGLAELRLGVYTPAVPGTGTPASFVWDIAQDPVFNTPMGDKMIQFDAAGTTAVFVRSVNFSPPVVLFGVYVAQRSSITSVFNTPQPILGIRGLGNFADPALGTAQEPGTGIRKQMLFYVGSLAPTTTAAPVQGLWMDELRLNTVVNGQPPANYSGFAPRLLAVPSAPGLEVHSPTPIVGNDGDVEGLWFSEVDRATSTSSQWFADDLDPATPAVQVFPAPLNTWLNNGVILGGQFLVANTSANTAPTPPLTEAWGAWTVGDWEPCGSANPIDITVGGVPGSTALVFLSIGLGATPWPVPGVIGLVGLDNTVQFTGLTCPLNVNGVGAVTMPTPPIGPLCGTVLFTQSGVFELGTNNIVATNTARVRI
jgi:hypothetical protein